MSLMTKPSVETGISIGFITGGTLTAVWSAIWYAYLRNNASEATGLYYVCTGLFLSGMVLVVIGVTIGRIGRAARQAEMPPAEITPAMAVVDQNAAARAPIVAPVNPGQQPIAPAPATAPTQTTPVAVQVPANNVYVPPRGTPSVR